MNKSKSFAGQPVLSQILDVIPSSLINKAKRKYQSNRYYKKWRLLTHLVSLLYGVFSYCNGLRELCEGLLGCEGKLSHLGFDKAYTVYQQFAKWTTQKIWFVTHMKDNADFHVTKVLVDKTKRKMPKEC